jgi:hypothetical protein
MSQALRSRERPARARGGAARGRHEPARPGRTPLRH